MPTPSRRGTERLDLASPRGGVVECSGSETGAAGFAAPPSAPANASVSVCLRASPWLCAFGVPQAGGRRFRF